ncbi:MAG: N-acetyltransferase [Dermatophilus congolensis]|nr:N-acetyltransferase [Dermatophilus congolensis]
MTVMTAPALAGGEAIWTPARHPLARFLRGVAAGTPPVADGSWMRVSPWSQHIQAVLSFAGHAVLAVSYDFTDVQLTELGVDGWGNAASPRVLTQLAGPSGWIGSHDMLLLGAGRGSDSGGADALVSRPDLAHRPAAEHAKRILTDVQVMGRPDHDDHDLVILARGVGGLREVSVDVAPDRRGDGHGVELLARALASVPENELIASPVFAGDAPAVAAYLASGFVHVGSVQHFSSRPERR